MFVIGWLVPFFLVGSTLLRLPFKVPTRLSLQYKAAALFTRRLGQSSQMVIQIRRTTQSGWQTLDVGTFAPMCTSGYRYRLGRIMDETKNKPIADAVQQRLAAWVVEQVAREQSEHGTITTVRFAQTIWKTNSPEMAMPEGHWVGNPPKLPPGVRFMVLSTYTIENGKAVKAMIPSVEGPVMTPSARVPSVSQIKNANPSQASNEKAQSRLRTP